MAYPNLTHNNDNKAMKFTLHMIATSKCKFMYLKQDTGMAYSTSGQTLPSSPSGHPPPLLAANLTPRSYPAVIFYPSCLRSNSPLSAQWSSSTPTGSQPHPSTPSGYLLPILLAVKLSPILGANLTPPPGDGRQETRDERRETRDGRREMRDEG